MRPRTLLIFLVLLVPSGLFVSKYPDNPDFGRLHDDGLFFVSAKSLASGQGFHILSLPEQPAQTKYPILYPLYLSLVWRMNPHFPDNLILAAWSSWVLMVLCLALTWRYWKDEGWSDPRIWMVVALLAINPYVILLGCSLFSEIFFLCWLLVTLIVARKEGLPMALLAGILAGCVYLSRTAGIALVLSMPAYYLWRREPRRALAFAAGMLPFIAGWNLWTAANKVHASDATLIYYTNYAKFQFMNVGLDNLAVVLWKNTDQLLFSLGSLILPEFMSLLPLKTLTQVIAIAMLSGIVRLVRRGIAVPYALFALVSSGMLIVWHFPPTQRFVLPILPLLVAGLVTELDHLIQMLRTAFRHKDVGQRVIAGIFALALVAIFGAALGLQLYVTFKGMPAQAANARTQLAETRATYAWIEQNVPPNAGILSADDPLLYLYTGHPGNLPPLLTRWWYAGDHTKMVKFFEDVVPYCRTRGYRYILTTPTDMARWSEGEDQAAVDRAMKNPQLEPLYKSPSGATLFHIK